MLYTHAWNATFSNALAAVPFSMCSNPSPNPHSSTNTALHITAPFRSALTNWKRVWDDLKLSTDRHEWFKLGFSRSSETFYNITRAILKAYEELREKHVTDSSGSGWRDFIGHIPGSCARGEHLKKILGAE